MNDSVHFDIRSVKDTWAAEPRASRATEYAPNCHRNLITRWSRFACKDSSSSATTCIAESVDGFSPEAEQFEGMSSAMLRAFRRGWLAFVVVVPVLLRPVEP